MRARSVRASKETTSSVPVLVKSALVIRGAVTPSKLNGAVDCENCWPLRLTDTAASPSCAPCGVRSTTVVSV